MGRKKSYPIDIQSLPQPVGATPRQVRLAAILPHANTATEAMIEAGYADSTAHANSRLTCAAVGVEIATRAIEAASRIGARGIHRKGLSILANRLNDNPHDALVIAALDVTARSNASGICDDDDVFTADKAAAARLYIEDRMRAALVIACPSLDRDAQDVVISMAYPPDPCDGPLLLSDGG